MQRFKYHGVDSYLIPGFKTPVPVTECREVRELYEDGLSRKLIAEQGGISASKVAAILKHTFNDSESQ